MFFNCIGKENMLSKKGAMNNRNNKTVYGQIKLVVLCVDNFSHLYHFTTVYGGTEQYITPLCHSNLL